MQRGRNKRSKVCSVDGPKLTVAQSRPESDGEAPTDDVCVEEGRNRREEVTAAAGEECAGNSI